MEAVAKKKTWLLGWRDWQWAKIKRNYIYHKIIAGQGAANRNILGRGWWLWASGTGGCKYVSDNAYAWIVEVFRGEEVVFLGHFEKLMSFTTGFHPSVKARQRLLPRFVQCCRLPSCQFQSWARIFHPCFCGCHKTFRVNPASAKLTLNLCQIRLFELWTLAYRNDAGRHN